MLQSQCVRQQGSARLPLRLSLQDRYPVCLRWDINNRNLKHLCSLHILAIGILAPSEDAFNREAAKTRAQ